MEAPPLERKLAAILAADVEGYSRLMHANEEATLATLTSHRTIVDDLLARGNGRICGTAGDSVLAEFASVADAVTCAVAIQQALHKANAGLPEGERMDFRIGINVGDVMVKDGDIFGDGVNVAARLEALAEPGGICVTRGVRDHLRDRGGFDFEDLGEQAVKNIPRTVRAFRVLFDPNASVELAPNVTPVETDEAARDVPPAAAGSASADPETIELAFWQSVEASGDAAEYQAYLDRYPQGTFAALAQARVMSPPAQRESAPETQAVELAFWDTVKESDDPKMFEAYLAKYPEGEFSSLAEIKLQALGRIDETNA